MSKTPRTLEMISLAFGEDGKGDDYAAYARAMTLCKQLETELADMRERFKEYVESVSELLHEDTSDACAEHHNKLHEKAKETLGL